MANDYSKITLKGDNDPLKNTLDEAIDMFKDWGDTVKYTVQDILGVGSFDELWSKIKDGVAAFEASNEGVTKLGYAIKASGAAAGFTTDKMREMNTELRKVVKDSTDTITEAQRALLQYTNVRQRAEGNIFQDTIKGASDLSAAVGGDLVSNTELLGKALQSPKDAFEDLAAVGVTFTRQQQQMITVLQNTGRGVQAQKMILQELSDMYGGAGEKAANTFGARMAKLNEYYDSAWKKIGEYLVPYLNKFIDAIEKINRVLDYYQAQLVTWFEGMADAMGSSFGSGTDWLKKFADVCVRMFSAAQAAVQEWQSFIIGGFFKVLELGTAAFKKLSEVVVKWAEHLSPLWEAMVKGAVAAWNGLKEAAKPVFEYLGKWGTYLVERFKEAFEALVKAWDTTLKTMMAMGKLAFANMLSQETGPISFDVIMRNYGKAMGSLFGGKSKVKAPGMPEGGDGESTWQKVSGSVGKFFQDFKAGSAKIWEGMDKDVKAFLEKYGSNAAANAKTFDEFYKRLMAIANGQDYKNVKGDPSSRFKNGGQDDGGKFGGGLEDLVALNRRITGAAAKSPELTELQRQTALQQQIANNTRGKPQQPLRPSDPGSAGGGSNRSGPVGVGLVGMGIF